MSERRILIDAYYVYQWYFGVTPLLFSDDGACKISISGENNGNAPEGVVNG